jgi:hypothetical protein
VTGDDGRGGEGKTSSSSDRHFVDCDLVFFKRTAFFNFRRLNECKVQKGCPDFNQ